MNSQEHIAGLLRKLRADSYSKSLIILTRVELVSEAGERKEM